MLVSAWTTGDSAGGRTTLGVRTDVYVFDVTPSHPANSGSRSEALVSSKSPRPSVHGRALTSTRTRAWATHSNDARGAVITVDPKSGGAAERVTPLVRAPRQRTLACRPWRFEAGSRPCPLRYLDSIRSCCSSVTRGPRNRVGGASVYFGLARHPSGGGLTLLAYSFAL